MEANNMSEWNEFKNELKKTNTQVKQDIEEMEMLVEIVSAIIDKRNELGYSQRELAKICGLPQSSVARIESYNVKPKIETLIKIMRPLGLKFTVVSM